MKGYTIVDCHDIESHIKFLRINPTDLKLTLKHILDSLMDLSWISTFDREFLKSSYEKRSKSTVAYIAEKIIKKDDDTVTTSSGEYVVSELARQSIIESYAYLDVPIAELFKKKVIGNHGFDFYSLNSNKNILFGEAKYIASQNAYGSALTQIAQFYNDKQHITDIVDIQNFFCDESLENCHNNDVGFIAAFSSKTITTDMLIENIKKNKSYVSLCSSKEIILVAVNI